MFRILLIVCLSLLSLPALADDQAERERALQQSGFVDPSAGLKKITVTILPFSTPKDQPDMEQFGEGTMDSLTSAMKSLPNFIMVDRGRIVRVMQEQAFQQTGLVDPKLTVRIGKLLGAQTVISGSIEAVGSGDDRQVTIIAYFVNVQTGEVKVSRQVKGMLKEIFDLQEQLVTLFTTQEKVAVTPEQKDRVTKVLKSTSNLTAYDFYLKGRKSFLQVSQKGYSDAIEWYRKAIQTDARYALAHAGMAEAWSFWASWKQQTGQPYKHEVEELFKSAQLAVQLNPELPEAHRAYGDALDQLGKPGGEAEIRKALTLNPNDAETWHRLWRVSGNMYNPDNDYIRKALELNPDLAAAHNDRGVILFRVKRHQEAISEDRTALRINPNMEMTHYNLGSALLATQSYDEATTHYREALRLNPAFVQAHYGLGDALNAQKHYDEAIASYRAALRLNPNAAAAHCGLGNSLGNLKRYDEAISAYNQALRIDPYLSAAHSNLVIVLRAMKKDREAQAEDERFAKTTEIVGIGANFSFQEQQLRVVSLLDNSPALQAGVRPGDRITGIDGHDTSQMRSIGEVVSYLKGQEGAVIKLTLQRNGEAGPLELAVTRRKFSIAH